jgi:hypothetical protein
MKIASTLSVAFLAGLSVATWTSLASAQSPGWAAAAAQCRTQVGNQYPTAEESSGMRSARARAYPACLADLGYRPWSPNDGLSDHGRSVGVATLQAGAARSLARPLVLANSVDAGPAPASGRGEAAAKGAGIK